MAEVDKKVLKVFVDTSSIRIFRNPLFLLDVVTQYLLEVVKELTVKARA